MPGVRRFVACLEAEHQRPRAFAKPRRRSPDQDRLDGFLVEPAQEDALRHCLRRHRGRTAEASREAVSFHHHIHAYALRDMHVVQRVVDDCRDTVGTDIANDFRVSYFRQHHGHVCPIGFSAGAAAARRRTRLGWR